MDTKLDAKGSGAGTARPARKPAKLGGKVSRRTVVVAAGAAAGGLAVTRVLGLHKLGPDPLALVNPTAAPIVNTKDWVSPLDKPEAQVAQLLRRATFGMTKAQYDAALVDGFKKTVDKLIETPPAAPKDLAGADAATQDKPINPGNLQAWWVDQILTTPTPFAERMTYFWHGHFTSDYRKVTTQTPFIYWQNLTWRKFALDGFRDLLYQVTIDPGMLRYLDLGQSTGKAPNENYSRELMELFTMGPGNYTEDDVKAAAKGLAGWRLPRTKAIIDAQIEDQIKRTGQAPKVTPVADQAKTGIFEKGRAYNGPDVVFLGQKKKWDTQAVLDRILEQDAVAPFIARKLLVDLVSPQIEDATVSRIADRFRKSRYDTKTLMSDVLTSPEFTSASAYRALVKSPTEMMVSAAKALEAPQLSKLIAGSGEPQGQLLFDPPSVGGWPDNASWISSSTMLARINFVTTALAQTKKLPSAADAHAQFLDSTLSPQTLGMLNATTDDRRRWAALLCCAEFQLK